MRREPSIAPAPHNSAGSACAYPWIPDQQDGTFRNPILHADYSDPDVIRHGADFYLTASSFNCTPGLPILHSRDLVNWTIINHALKNLPHPRYDEVQRGCGVWAPAIRFHARKFWIFFATPDEGIYVTSAADPAGDWSAPHLVQAGKGLIDPCPLWDDDGQAHLIHAYAGSRAGVKHILRVCPMAPDGSRLLGEGKIVFESPAKHPTIEGPKFLKHQGWYYILAPAGGVATGWQVVLRARNIHGPYEDSVVLEQGATPINGPHQGALVDTPGGEWWFIHFQDAGPYGRVIHLQPVTWRDGWPLIGFDADGNGIGEPVLRHAKPDAVLNGAIVLPQTSDEFASPKLGLQWQWHANHKAEWHSLSAHKGWLRLFPQTVRDGNLERAPQLLLQKFPARTFIVETLLEFAPGQTGEEAGLIIAGKTAAALALRHYASGNQIVLRMHGVDEVLQKCSGNTIKLRVAISEGGRCEFSFADQGKFIAAAETFQANAGVWIGAKVGLYSLRRDPENAAGHADFDYFRFLPNATAL